MDRIRIYIKLDMTILHYLKSLEDSDQNSIYNNTVGIYAPRMH